MSKPFTIYLDIDGVLVSYLKLKDWNEDGHHNFVPEAVVTLNAIITMFDADLCIVSTWGRGYWNGHKDPIQFREILERRGVIVNGLTFGDPDDRAGFVIKQKKEGFVNFLIIDDEALEYFRREEEIGYNRILYSNSWRCLDSYDLVGVTRNYERLISDYPEGFYKKHGSSIHKK